jgi:signal transduction protein with GAF and PtsI domain
LLHDKELISTLLEITAEYKFEKILRLVVDKIPGLVDGARASVFWLDREGNRIVLRDTYPENRVNIGKRSYRMGEGLTGWVAQTGKPLRVKNIEDESELKRIDSALHWSDKYDGFRQTTFVGKTYQRAFLAVPIKIEGVTMGVLRIAKTIAANKCYTKQHEDLLLTIADYLATILKKAQLLEAAEEFDTLIKPEYFQNPETMDAYFRWVADLIPTILNSSGCMIFVKDEDVGSYVLRYTSKGNPLKKKVNLISYRSGNGLIGWVLLSGDSLRINDIKKEEELKRKYPGAEWTGKHLEFKTQRHSYFMAAPIRTPQETYGVICLTRKAESIPFTVEDERLLHKYGKSLGESLRSLQLEEHGTMLVRPKWKARYPINKNRCFILMPYRQAWSDNIRLAIKNAVESRKLEFKIADESHERDIMPDVWKGICEARIVIADLSSANPNVAYEVGLADVVGKEMILLAQDPSKVPVDFAGARLLLYDPNKIKELQSKLGDRISQILGQRHTQSTSYKVQ